MVLSVLNPIGSVMVSIPTLRVVYRAFEWYIVCSSGRSCVLVVDRELEW